MLDALLAPKTVALVGASRNPDKVGHALLANLKRGGFAGRLVAVNPHAESILEIPCVADPERFGEKIELAVIAVPAESAELAVKKSIWAGARAVVVISSGFKESGEQGARAERSIAEFCSEHGVRLLGPNSVGLINTASKLNATFARQAPRPGGVSILSQSGAICAAILGWAEQREIGIAKMVSMGNKADLTEVDLLEALGEDEATEVVACYIESIESGDDFIRVVEQVTSVKPVVVLKSGTTAGGASAVSSHTGRIAGEEIAYGAAFQRAGVIHVDTLEELFDRTRALSSVSPPAGDRVAVVTNSGGPAILAVDAMERAGLKTARLSEATRERLAGILPRQGSATNTVDLLADAPPQRYSDAVRAVIDDPGVDAVLVVLAPLAMTRPHETAARLAELAASGKPLLAAFMGGSDVLPARRELSRAGIPDFPSPGRAVEALEAMRGYSAWRNRPPRVVTRFPVNRRRVERILKRCERAGRPRLSELEAKEVLRAYDFHVPEGHLATTADEAVEVADRVGYPVAAKILSPDIPHKAEVGGVRLDLATADALRDAFDLMMLRVPRRLPDARIDGVYVEQMAPRGREVIIGMSHDPQFGPMLMFGLGGIFVEVMEDVAFHLAPITADEAMQMLRSTRSFALLRGDRGRDKVDLGSIAGGLQRISQLATDFPQIEELDLNPFIVRGVGAEAMAVDARMILAEPRKNDE
jgi:acetate---CoA ligase (ADP-forming)